MNGSIIVKRDPVSVGILLTAILLIVGAEFDWSLEVTGTLSAVIAAGVGVVQALNVFGTDMFTALAVNFTAAIVAAAVAWGVPVDEKLGALIIGVVVAALGLFARNGITNKYTPLGAVLPTHPSATV